MKVINEGNGSFWRLTVTLARAFMVAGCFFWEASTFAQTLSIQSGSAIDVAQPTQPDSLVQIAAESQGLSQIAPADLPILGGTFWWVMPGGAAVPAPCPPLDLSGAIYQIADGQFLVDETGGQVVANTHRFGLQAQSTSTVASEVAAQADAVVNLITQVQTSAANQQMGMQAMAMDVPSPGDVGGGGTYTPEYSTPAPNYGTNLWIANFALSSSNVVGIVSNTEAYISYEIQSRENLVDSNDWNSEGFILGSKPTNWTPLSVAQGSRKNLFIRLKSWADTTGTGIPDWWWWQYFGQITNVDPYALDSAGDGYDNIQKFQMGLNPTNFSSPPAPSGLYAYVDSTGTNALISWSPAQGAVTNYIVYRGIYDFGTGNYDYSQIAIVSASTTSFEDIGGYDPSSGNYYAYEVAAGYPGGGSSQSAFSYLYYSPPTPTTPTYNLFVAATLVRNTTGRWQLMFAGLPASAQTIQLTWTDNNYNTTAQNISINSLTNGIYYIPDTDVINYLGDSLSVQLTETNGIQSEVVQAGVLPNDAPYSVDGRQHMKQNLNFLIRAASRHLPFAAFFGYGRLNLSATNFEEFSFLCHDSDYYGDTWVALDNLWPFTENYGLANYFIDTSRTNAAQPPGGTTNFNFQPNFATNIPAPPILTHADPYWILAPGFNYYFNYNGDAANWGVTVTDTNMMASLQSGLDNLFGLPYQTGCEVDFYPYIDPNVGLPYFNSIYQPLAPGNSVTVEYPGSGYVIGSYASWCPAPTLQFVNYYIAPLVNPGLNPMSLPSVSQQPFPLPIDDNFVVTNQTPPLMIGAVGQPMIVGAWAKYSIQGSSPTKYAYLGQYFTNNAYLLGASGVITTNIAGILSPYGEFFPTQGGQAALVTMPDIDTGRQATGIVQVISVNVDANHDGTMDLSFNGADATSQASPMVWWINNDHDWSYYPGDPGEDVESTPNFPDYSVQNIPSQRDLEDWARLWICGMPALTNAGYQVTLSWNVSSGNPAVNLVNSVETNGGIGYLTDTNIAAAQTTGSTSSGPSYKFASVTPSQSYTFPNNFFTNNANKYFLFEGAGIGSGELVLTIFQNGNPIAQTGVWLDLHDIKDFYEQAVITDNMSGAKSTWTSTIEKVQPATSALGNDTNLIVLVHGINVLPWDCLNDAETVYKRLYWAGYQGKFAEVKWPCNLLTPIPSPLSPAVFNQSELQAYKASTALATYLTQLRARFPGYRLNLLVHSQGNALVSEAIKRGGVSFDTYILTQGALPESAYDVNAPIDAAIAVYDQGTQITPEWQPMGYHGIYTNFTGRIVNFFNSQDGVLNYWVTDQEHLKPSFYLDTSYYYYDGTNSYFDPFIGFNYMVTDPEESRAMVSRSRTLPIGQSGPASAHGVIQSAVDLNAQFGFNSAIAEHSAQWTRPIQTSLPYYQQLLLQIQPVP